MVFFVAQLRSHFQLPFFKRISQDEISNKKKEGKWTSETPQQPQNTQHSQPVSTSISLFTGRTMSLINSFHWRWSFPTISYLVYMYIYIYIKCTENPELLYRWSCFFSHLVETIMSCWKPHGSKKSLTNQLVEPKWRWHLWVTTSA